MNSASASDDRDPVDQLAEEFVERYRRGERPSLTEYAEAHPDLADQIRDVFPALMVMERLKPAAGDPTTGPAGIDTETTGATPPQRLGDYHILREVGRGGMGVVYEAVQESVGRHIAMNRHVALKVLAGHALANPTYLERFRREVRAAGRLHHTNIVPVFGTGECDGNHFYAMQFIRGQGLDAVLHDLRRLRQREGGAATTIPSPLDDRSIARSILTGRFGVGTFEPDQSPGADSDTGKSPLSMSQLSEASSPSYYRGVARMGLQVAEALAYAHRHGVLHRDIKPSNLLLDLQGTVWVTDFGLAKSDDAGDLTNPGDIVGTIRYMAPERFDGRSLPQSDVYGLGLTLYELLTLRPAFTDPHRARLIEKVLHEPPAPPRRLDRAIPRDLETIVLKCLAKDPAERYPGADGLAEDLRRFLADRPIRARRAGPAERTWRWCRRNPAVAALVSCVFLLLTALAVGSLKAAFLLRDERDEVRQQRDNVRKAKDKLTEQMQVIEAAERDKTRQLALAKFRQAQALRWSGRAGRRFDSLVALGEAAKIARDLRLPAERVLEMRNEAVAAIPLVDLRVAQRWAVKDGEWVVEFDPALRRYATHAGQGNLILYRTADHQEILRLPGFGPTPWVLRFSPDGRFLAVKYHNDGFRDLYLGVWDVDRRQLLLKVPGGASSGEAIAFSPDSRTLAVGRSDGTVHVYDMENVKELTHFPTAGPEVRSLSFHPDGRRIALSSGNNAQVRDVRTGKLLGRFAAPAHLFDVAWDADGKRLAGACTDHCAYVWDAERGEMLATLKGHQAEVVEVAFNHAGNLLATRSWDLTTRLWDVASGRSLVSIRGRFQGFSPDDRLLAFTDHWAGEAGVWEVAVGRECRILHGHGGGKGPHTVSFSPDGLLIASASGDGVRLWDAATGKHLALLTRRPALTAVFHPDGRSLIVSGPDGLYRWPINFQGNRLLRARFLVRFGPPQSLFPGKSPDLDRCSISADGRWLAVAENSRGRARLLDLQRPGKVKTFGPHKGIQSAVLSPDGRWLCTSSWPRPAVKIWDTNSGKLVKELSVQFTAFTRFSPDGRWLATGNPEECVFWEVGNWKPGLRLPPHRAGADAHPLAFSPDGKVLAVGRFGGLVQLVDASTGRELATLEPPDSGPLTWLCFSPDGTRLAVSCSNHLIQVWDLRQLREELERIGLDWDMPPYPPAPEKPHPPQTGPLTIEVESGNRSRPVSKEQLRDQLALYTLLAALNPCHPEPYHKRGHVYEKLGQAREAVADFSAALAWETQSADRAHLFDMRATNYLRLDQHDEAIADLEASLALKPNNPRLRRYLANECNNRAWRLATGPQGQRDPARVLKLARRAVELAPSTHIFLNTLGVAEYRSGQYREAKKTLEKSRALGKGAFEGFDLFFLAMCHAKLGDKQKARDCFDRAVQWVERQKDLSAAHAAELKAFRAEAEAALRE